MTTLYHIAGEYLAAFDALELDPETGELMGMAALEELGGRLEEKLEAAACYIKEQRVLAEAIKAEEAALNERRKGIEKRTEWLRQYLGETMESVGRSEFESARCRLSFRRSSSVSILDEAVLPEEYVRVTESRRPDKTAIGKALKAGQSVPGAELAEKRSLQIR